MWRTKLKANANGRKHFGGIHLGCATHSVVLVGYEVRWEPDDVIRTMRLSEVGSEPPTYRTTHWGKCLLHRLCWFSLVFPFFRKASCSKKKSLARTRLWEQLLELVRVLSAAPSAAAFWVRPNSSALILSLSPYRAWICPSWTTSSLFVVLRSTLVRSSHSALAFVIVVDFSPMQSCHDAKQLKKSNSVNGQSVTWSCLRSSGRSVCITWHGYSTQ